jgi:hypothetical protein
MHVRQVWQGEAIVLAHGTEVWLRENATGPCIRWWRFWVRCCGWCGCEGRSEASSVGICWKETEGCEGTIRAFEVT